MRYLAISLFLDNYIFCIRRKLLINCESYDPISLIPSALIIVIVAVIKTCQGSERLGTIAEVRRFGGC